MFRSTAAQILWVLVPVLTIGFAAAVPFVAAAVKGVVKPWVAGLYIGVELTVVVVLLTLANGETPIPGLILVLFVITAATHTGLLDSERVTFGK